MASEKRSQSVLGRGLDSLIGDIEFPIDAGQDVLSVSLDGLLPNPNQPRRHFPERALRELADSISSQGIVQPLVVRSHPTEPDKYQIVAGERRWRAAQLAGLEQVPALQRDLSDEECLLVALVENIHRADLNPIDEASTYESLMKDFGWTQQQLADQIGKSRSHVANTVRLLKLPTTVRKNVQDSQLSAGHARALLPSPDPEGAAAKVVSGGLSVRQTEKLVSRQKTPATGTSSMYRPRKAPDTSLLEASISANLKAKVSIVLAKRGHSGKLIINFTSTRQLEDLYSKLVHGKPRRGGSDKPDS